MKKLMSLIFTLTFLSAAFAQDVEVQSISNIDPSTEFETYAFMDDMSPDMVAVTGTSGSQSAQSEESQNNGRSGWAVIFPIENSMIKEAIDYELDVAGLEKTSDNPDVLIQYHIFNKDYAEDDNYIKAFEDYEYSYPKKADLMSNIEDGTLVVSIVDNETNKSVWEGFAYTDYEESASLDDKQHALRQGVDAIVTQFLADNEDMLGIGDGVSR